MQFDQTRSGRKGKWVPTLRIVGGSGKEPDKDEEPANPSEPVSWVAVTKFLAVVVTTGGLMLHLMGYMTHQAYLSAWGLDAGLFPLATDTIVINGLATLVGQTAAALDALEQGWKTLLVYGVVLFGYVLLIFRLGKSSRLTDASKRLVRPPELVADILKSVLIAFAALTLTPMTVIFVVFALAVPALTGQNFGKTLAKEEQARYVSGCEKAAARDKCVELRKAGTTVARGFLLESSATHVALFDVVEGRAKAMERDGMVLVADPPRTPAAGATK